MPVFWQKAGIWAALLVVAFSAFLFLYQLGTKPFWDYDEAIYANVIHDTLQSGTILTLRSGATPWFEKPPLSLWLGMGADTIFHHPEFSYRLTAALAGILSIILVGLITFEVSGSWYAAALAGLFLITTGPFLEAGRELRLDVPAIAMDLLAVYYFIRGQKSPRWLLGVGVALGLGFLFKSLIGLLAIPCILLWAFFNWDFRWIRSVYFWLAALCFLIVFLPWHLYETTQFGGAFWSDYFFHHVLQRFGSNIIGSSTTTGDYINFFFIYAAPWSVLWIPNFIWAAIKYKREKSDLLRAAIVFSSTALVLFITFAFASTKIYDYLLPIYPFVAISVALCAFYILSALHSTKFGFALTALTLVSILGLWVSVGFGYHLFAITAQNDLIVSEEHDVALLLKQDPTVPVYAFQYDYWDTIRYYSGQSNIEVMSNNQNLDQSFYLLVPGGLFDHFHLPAMVEDKLSPLYKGKAVELYKFNY